MKKFIYTIGLAVFSVILMALAPQESTKLITKTGHINFFSHTEVEDISADNYQVSSTLEKTTGAIVVVAPMQSFEFEKAMMQKHYNSPKFLDTKQFPKAKFKGTISNLADIKFDNNGTYPAKVEGTLTMHGVSKEIMNEGSITVKDGKVTVNTKMNIVLADFNVVFESGKPSTSIAKTVEATINITY